MIAVITVVFIVCVLCCSSLCTSIFVPRYVISRRTQRRHSTQSMELGEGTCIYLSVRHCL